jgi:hypothetical protein
MDETEREKNPLKVAKYRARKKAREQGLDPDALASAPTDHDPACSTGTAKVATLSASEAEALKEECGKCPQR